MKKNPARKQSVHRMKAVQASVIQTVEQLEAEVRGVCALTPPDSTILVVVKRDDEQAS